ncbi:MAG: HTTM domain-containing protein [Isosphaeraceae bacterium]
MNPLRLWNAFWFGPISARPLGVFRVVLGLLTLAHLGMLTVDVDHWLTDQGLLRGTEALELAGPLRPSPLLWIQDPISVRAFLAGSAVVALAVTVGWRTRITSALLYLAILSIHQRNLPTNSGPDNLLLILLFYLMLSPSGAAHSLDARRLARRRGASAEPLIVPWAQRLIQIHLCLIYFDTSVLKCSGTTWLDGTALHYVLYNHEVGRFDFSFLAQYPILINAMTHLALLVEFALAFLLWFRVTRPWTAMLGLGLHAGILAVVNVPLFGELMAACYLTFLTPQELDATLRTVNPRHWWARRPERALPASVRVDGPERLQGPHDLGEVVASDAPGNASRAV